MKKALLCVLLMCMCLILTGCGNDMEQEEIDRIGNLINGG